MSSPSTPSTPSPSDSRAAKQAVLNQKWLEKATYDNTVVFLLENLEKLNCPFSLSSSARIQTCPPTHTGGFSMSASDPHIILCSNNIPDYASFHRTLVHELVHAIDKCRSKADWADVRHHACTEVRASGLSGECKWGVELSRGNLAVVGGWEKCVKRRAKLSLGHHGRDGERAVEEVFGVCSRDTYPFMRHPNQMK